MRNRFSIIEKNSKKRNHLFETSPVDLPKGKGLHSVSLASHASGSVILEISLIKCIRYIKGIAITSLLS